MKLNTSIALLIVTFIALSCVNNSNHSQTRLKSAETKIDKGEMTIANESSSSDCDPNKWNYVYDPERLQVLDKCKVVTGVITERNADPDGDEHMLLKLDEGQKHLLTKKNKTKKDGCLVIEAVCINKITRKKAMGACKGYANNVWLPKVGDHVKVTGSFVLDSHNGWNEIHPISKVEKL